MNNANVRLVQIDNRLPLLLDCLARWERPPEQRQFVREYAEPMKSSAGDLFMNFAKGLSDLHWENYRSEALQINPEREETRLRRLLGEVESLFGFQLSGVVILMGGFCEIDGYARFDQGSHTVFLGVDEIHARGKSLDILTVHELTHVARESRPEVWLGFGLNPKMTQHEFTQHQPVVEHLMGEGFSCAVSEILVPGQPDWEYVYQTPETLVQVLENRKSLDRIIRAELSHSDGDYGRLYRTRPIFAHYVWAWQWVKSLLKQFAGGDPKLFVSRCSKEFIPDALKFEMALDLMLD